MTSAEDNDDQFRVVAVDKHGNRRVSPTRLVSVPIDDRNASFSYTGTWVLGGSPVDFKSTLSTSSMNADSVTLSFNKRYVAWVAPRGGGGQATVSTGGGGTTVVLDGSGARQIVFQHTFASAVGNSITITVDTGPVPIDGIIVR